MFASACFFFGLLALACGFHQPNSTRHTLDGRIVGGRYIDIRQTPYQVSVQSPMLGHLCGGSIISRRHVVTAAHCISGVISYQIRAGSTYHKHGGVVVKVAKASVHPKHERHDRDVAVLELEKDLVFSDRIQPIQLVKHEEVVPDGAMAMTSGWGAKVLNGLPNPHLQAVDVPMVNHHKCARAYRHTLTENMICAGYDEGGRNACQGDSGGPLVQNGKLVGIVSWGDGCAKPRKPGIYASVSALRNFIREKSGV